MATELELRKLVVANAKSLIGLNESDGSFKKIIDIYNSHTPLPRGYKMKYTDEWCATTVSAIGIMSDMSDIMLRECSCSAMITLYKAIGRWCEDDSHIPQMADIIMYDWSDNGIGDDTNAPDHVGIVTDVRSGSIIVIEGNKHQKVDYRTIPVDGKFIRGFCLPDYASKSSVEDDDMNIDNLTDEQIDKLTAKIVARLATQPVSEYAKTACTAGVTSKLFSDGDNNGMIDNPRGFMRREEFAVVLHRNGII